MHIRRGDKILHESNAFPILLYYRALRRLCLTRPAESPCPRTVYVFCDDAAVCREFSNLAGKCFHVTSFHEQVALGKIAPFFKHTPALFQTQKQFNALPERDRQLSGQEVLISVYLAALSDLFVCTYSSNICRLVALLRNVQFEDLSRSILSLDWDRWEVSP